MIPFDRQAIEALAGNDFANVKVSHSVSSKLGALAFAEGKDIHIPSYRNAHLAHESSYVVSGMQLPEVITSLANTRFGLASFRWSEALGQPFTADIILTSESAEIAIENLIKQPLSLHLDGKPQAGVWLSGLISRIELIGPIGNLFGYSARVVPFFDLMRHSGGCRIFQDLSTVEIVQEVLEAHSYSAQVESRLKQTYTTRPYCVQYGESDFQFLQRLMEEEGIYYFFEYEKSKHTMILVDDLASHKADPWYSSLEYRSTIHEGTDEYLVGYRASKEFGTGTVTLNDYDFEKPKSPLQVKQQTANRATAAEWYGYPGMYTASDDGQRLARIRMESEDAAREQVQFGGNARGMRAGAKFTLTNHTTEAANKDYLIVASELSMEKAVSKSGARPTVVYRSALRCQDSKRPFRSRQTTMRPFIPGPHIATVCGKSGEEIWTDSYGRVKVQFPWDRDGASNELSSCWIRVSQAWTGKNWGAMSLPRIGDEVIVEFLDGNPDRPIITGRVYNAERMPPEKLADAQAKTIFRTRSTKGGDATAFHELTFDDTKDKELILFQSERDFNRIVENDDSLKVGFEKKSPGNRTVEIYNDESIKVGLGSGAGKYSLEAATSILLKCGDSTIELTPSGVQITAPSITLKATGEFKTQATNVTIQADAALKVTGNATANLESAGKVVIKGGMVEIN